MSFDSTVNAKAIELIRVSYDMTAQAGSGHPTSCASIAHLVTVLMYDYMRYEPANPGHPSSDRLVLSEGHSVPIVYAACADRGVCIGKDKNNLRPMTHEDAMSLRAIDSVIDGHPNPVEGFPFFDTATGSLGQGLSHAAGLAGAAHLDELDKRIYCIIGDGESREGQIWEAADFIKDYRLSAVCPIFNANVYAQSDQVSPQQSADSLVAKLKAYGFDVKDIDGHNPTAIKTALDDHAKAQEDDSALPVAIVARTQKGWGSPSQEGQGHHGKPATGDALTKAMAELDETAKQVGAVSDTTLKPGLMTSKKPAPAVINPSLSFSEALEKFGKASVLKEGKMATRKAYGVALQALGHTRSNVVALDCDVKNSSYSIDFYDDPQLNPRFFECHIAEQNMFSVAAGLSAGGKEPFCSTFAKFITRGYDQIEMAVNSGANFKVVGSHAGISLAADGPSQMSLPDIAWFRSFATMKRQDGNPGFYVLQPSDAYQAYALTMTMAEYDGPCYMRTLRPETEFLYSDKDKFALGGHEVLSKGRDLMVVASGYMVHVANKAMEKFDQQGIDVTLVDLYSLPFDSESLLDLANQNNGMILTLEDNYGGGFGSAVADVAAEDGGGFTVKQMHVNRIPKSGRTPEDLLNYTGLSPDDIVKEGMALLKI